MTTETAIRPTKKQREILSFIEQFIGQHGYSPSYREIMNGLQYTSVATVSLHVNSLIRRGHLRKRDRSARSLEVVAGAASPAAANGTANGQEKWLINQIERFFARYESSAKISSAAIGELQVLVDALHVLGLQEPAKGFSLRLRQLGKKAG